MFKKFLCALVVVGAMLYSSWVLSSISPSIQEIIVRRNAADSVVLITVQVNMAYNVTGTGFQVSDNKGHKYILTNRHICKVGKVITLENRKGVEQQVKIVKISPKYDLCILESFKDMEALSFTDSLYNGQSVYVVGHPKGMTLSVSAGKVVDFEEGRIRLPVKPFTNAECVKNGGIVIFPNNKSDDDSDSEFQCELYTKDLIITSPTRLGNSGSPVVTLHGKVIGIISMVDEVAWGVVVPKVNIDEFLNGGEK